MGSNALLLIIVQRLWQGLAGLLTVLIITATLTSSQQGWYYTFVSIAALYSIFEMGLSSAIIQKTAEMFTKLNWLPSGSIEGKGSSEFMSFHSISVRVYVILAIAFFIISLIVGIYIFEHREGLGVPRAIWMPPWIALIFFTALNLLTLPFLAVVEGSGDIHEVYKVRLFQGIFGAILCWLILIFGGWLWAAAAIPIASFLVTCLWLSNKRSGLIKMIFNHSSNKKFNWIRIIWPHQWRLGLNWVSVFLMSQLATPILFYFCDPTVAGKMGLSLTITRMLGIISQSWITRRVPSMAQSVVRREWHILDSLFKKDFTYSMVIFILGTFGIILSYNLLENSRYVDRLLPFWQFFGLFIFEFFYQINGAFSAQLRSFRREPLVWIFATGSMMILVGSIIGAKQGSVGMMVAVMIGVQAIFVFPSSFMLWRHFNKTLRMEPSAL
jgi:O-antigen/teichoic acid export membrane protein